MSSIDCNGVEWFDAGVEEEVQCARCGSSIASETQTSFDGEERIVRFCLSSPEYCEAHPLPGREYQRGAGRQP
jgi:hypothetical protein